MSGYWHNFDLTDGVNILRLICGLFFIPHIVAKFTEPATLGFFKAAKFNPPATWMYVAGAVETVLTIASGLRHLHALCGGDCGAAFVRRRCRHLEGDKKMDLGDRRHRILRVLDAGVRGACRPDLAALRIGQMTGSK